MKQWIDSKINVKGTVHKNFALVDKDYPHIDTD